MRVRAVSAARSPIDPGRADSKLDAMNGLRGVRPDHDEAERRATLAGEASAAEAEVAPVAAEPDPAAAAFFDLDNTIMRGASIYYLARGLAARKMFGARDLAKFAWGQVSFLLSGTENADHMEAAREAALAFVAGHKVADIASMGAEIYDETMADRIWAGARRLAQAAKAAAITALAEREGLDLSRCSAYSDSANDLPMLSVVGYPNAVNPDSGLRAHARREGWPIHDFRTGRRATMIALPVAAGAGAIAGGVAAGAAIRRRRRYASAPVTSASATSTVPYRRGAPRGSRSG